MKWGARNDTLFKMKVVPDYEAKEYLERGIGGGQTLTLPFGFFKGLPTAKFTKGTYEDIIRMLFVKNSAGYSGMDRVAKTAAAIPVKLFDVKEEEKIEVKDGPAFDLIHRPNPFTSWPEFVKEWIVYYMIAGNAYQHLIYVDDPPVLTEMWHLRPDLVKIITKKGRPVLYPYDEPGAFFKRMFKPEEILHTRTVNPFGTAYGMPMLWAALQAADTFNAATEINLAVLQNQAVLTGMINVGEETGDEELGRIKEKFNRQYAGPENAGQTFIIASSKLSYSRIGLSPQELGIADGKEKDAEAILSVIGCPPELIGRKSIYQNFKAAMKALYIHTVLPLMNEFIEALNRRVIRTFDENLVLELDLSKIVELREDQEKLFKRLSIAVKHGWMTINDAREIAGLPKDPRPFADEYYMPGTFVPISDMLAALPPEEE